MREIASDNHSTQAGRLVPINASNARDCALEATRTQGDFSRSIRKTGWRMTSRKLGNPAWDLIAAKILRFVIASPQSLADDVPHRHQ